MQKPTDKLVLRAINDNNMIFVSAQPDSTYFHWQVEIYLYQFAKHGIIDKCYALFGYTGDSPSAYVKTLATRYPNIRFYKDTRKPNGYSPTIRPHILAKFFKENPNMGKYVFYHDSDIFLTKLPRFDLMMQPFDRISYISDTISYIGYDYIKECSERYRTKYPELPELDIFYGMCKIMQIDPKIVKENQKNSGGAQYLLKNIDYTFWEECEGYCIDMYTYLSEYEKRYPIVHHIQKWTTDMWVVLWLYWKRGGKTIIHKELDFSWATGTVAEYNNMNIFHLAGVTGSNNNDKFYKGRYTKETIFDAYIKDNNVFDNISKDNATYPYTEIIKEYIHNVYAPYKGIKLIKSNQSNQSIQSNKISQFRKLKYNINNENVRKFKLNTTAAYSGIYNVTNEITCCNKYVWKSEDKNYIIFWNGNVWILTYAKYISEIGPNCGGLVSIAAEYPFLNGWNKPDIYTDIIN